MISASYLLRVVGWSSYDVDEDEVNGRLLLDLDREFLVVSSKDPSGLNSESAASGIGECGGGSRSS